MKFKVVCFDHIFAVEGELMEFNHHGCLIQDSALAKDIPAFSRRRLLHLKIESTNSETTEQSVPEALLLGFFRKNNRWFYQISWKEIPQILSKAS